jgi:hypothetical protein
MMTPLEQHFFARHINVIITFTTLCRKPIWNLKINLEQMGNQDKQIKFSSPNILLNKRATISDRLENIFLYFYMHFLFLGFFLFCIYFFISFTLIHDDTTFDSADYCVSCLAVVVRSTLNSQSIREKKF